MRPQGGDCNIHNNQVFSRQGDEISLTLSSCLWLTMRGVTHRINNSCHDDWRVSKCERGSMNVYVHTDAYPHISICCYVYPQVCLYHVPLVCLWIAYSKRSPRPMTDLPHFPVLRGYWRVCLAMLLPHSFLTACRVGMVNKPHSWRICADIIALDGGGAGEPRKK